MSVNDSNFPVRWRMNLRVQRCSVLTCGSFFDFFNEELNKTNKSVRLQLGCWFRLFVYSDMYGRI